MPYLCTAIPNRDCSCSKADFSEQRAQCQTCLSSAESRRKAEGIKKVSRRTFWSSESRSKARFDSAESRQKAAIFGTKIAEIAQLVEHDLAKVGVASSSLVFRSISQRENTRSFCYFQNNKNLVKVPKRTFRSSERSAKLA